MIGRIKMKAIVINSNEWVYPDIFEYESATDVIDVHVPRGGYITDITAFESNYIKILEKADQL